MPVEFLVSPRFSRERQGSGWRSGALKPGAGTSGWPQMKPTIRKTPGPSDPPLPVEVAHRPVSGGLVLSLPALGQVPHEGAPAVLETLCNHPLLPLDL